MLLSRALDRHGARARVAELDPKKRGDRAPFTCVACGERLVARLGERRARHFAHLPGAVCALTNPETLLHFEAKERLLFLCTEALAGRLSVVLLARCPGCRGPSPLALCAQGDSASAEGGVGALRADVLVTREGVPSLALEVRVTHAVGAEKEAALRARGLVTLEIDAREPWEEEVAGGRAVRVARGIGVAACGACALGARAAEARGSGGERAEVAELEAYRARGLMGSRPGPLAADWAPLTSREAAELASRFACPACGEAALVRGERIVRHACPGESARVVAWRGFDGALVELAWWRRRA